MPPPSSGCEFVARNRSWRLQADASVSSDPNAQIADPVADVPGGLPRKAGLMLAAKLHSRTTVRLRGPGVAPEEIGRHYRKNMLSFRS